MKGKHRTSFICQSCGALIDARSQRCGTCGRNPVIQTSFRGSESVHGPDGAPEKNQSRCSGECDELRSQQSRLQKENRSLAASLEELEKELIVTKAGLETLLGELCGRKTIDRRGFIGKWASQAKSDFKGLRLRELFLSKKWEFLGDSPGKNGSKYRSLIAGAESFFAAMEWEKAYPPLVSAEELAGESFPLAAFMARFAAETGKFADAVRYASKALEEKPLPLETIKLAALSNLMAGNPGEARKLADRWIREAGEGYEPLLFKACVKASSGRWDEAGKYCEKAIRKDEGLIPRPILAFSLLRQKKRGPAKKVLDAASGFYPASPEIKHMQHALHLLNGALEEAVTVRSTFPEAEDVILCRKREKLLNAKKIERFFETVEPDMEMVMSDLNADRPFPE